MLGLAALNQTTLPRSTAHCGVANFPLIKVIASRDCSPPDGGVCSLLHRGPLRSPRTENPLQIQSPPLAPRVFCPRSLVHGARSIRPMVRAGMRMPWLRAARTDAAAQGGWGCPLRQPRQKWRGYCRCCVASEADRATGRLSPAQPLPPSHRSTGAGRRLFYKCLSPCGARPVQITPPCCPGAASGVGVLAHLGAHASARRDCISVRPRSPL